MVSIDNSALEEAKNKNGTFVVKVASSNCSCCSAGRVRKDILIELLNDFTNPNNSYYEKEYEGVKIYLSKALILKENARIYKKASLPIIGPIFSSKGIEII